MHGEHFLITKSEIIIYEQIMMFFSQISILLLCLKDSSPKPKFDDFKSDDEFLSASEHTLQDSQSSSYKSASDCENLYSSWWDHEKDDVKEDVAKEKMVLAVGLPQLPLPESVLKPSPEAPPGKIVREVVETTHLKVNLFPNI